ncbi:MAG: hypothetical protein WC975_13185 [Phycisphaerae bacterium]
MNTIRGKILIGLICPALLAGCSGSQVQIWANSNSDDPKIYTQQNTHYIHVGEVAQLRIVVQPDIANYVTINLGGQLYMMPKVNPGEYALMKRFDSRWFGVICPVEVQAWRQNGRCDYLIEDNLVRKLATGDDPPDTLLASANTRVCCYQSKVVFDINLPGNKEPDWSKAVLTIFGPENRISTIYQGRVGLEGFTALGRDASGRYTIFYEPNLEQIHKTGKTRMVLTILDSDNKEQTYEIWLDTP